MTTASQLCNIVLENGLRVIPVIGRGYSGNPGTAGVEPGRQPLFGLELTVRAHFFGHDTASVMRARGDGQASGSPCPRLVSGGVVLE
ncbi:MAG TPA: hypothetical protein VHN36_08275, partial [Ilumatobacteraceae bacterium]|nr:hypothetical protein [Ilumatobacteraceae bacterium]